MAAPVVAGAVALMIQANPRLTPNLAKAILQYTAQDYKYDALTQGGGFLNIKGAVDLARFLQTAKPGQRYPSNPAWTRAVLWGTHKLRGGVLKPAGSAYALSTVWGASRDAEGDNIVWGTRCGELCDQVYWGASEMDADNIVWGTFDREGDNIVWGTIRELDNIVWGTALESDNIVWGTECSGANCEGQVWGTSILESELDNIVWGTLIEADNIVWGTSTGDVKDVVWATSTEPDNATLGNAGAETPLFDDPESPSAFDGTVFEQLFDESAPEPAPVTPPPPPPAIVPETTTAVTSTIVAATTTLLGGGF
jgi:hypothetical protein